MTKHQKFQADMLKSLERQVMELKNEIDNFKGLRDMYKKNKNVLRVLENKITSLTRKLQEMIEATDKYKRKMI
ncbi:MAG: hypothetical protein DRQ78_07610 [Epsilonproteobacteria bacterium]|nr:MAG: hypothetical protein DRQ78_07610 [Campylobacterota bacterium]